MGVPKRRFVYNTHMRGTNAHEMLQQDKDIPMMLLGQAMCVIYRMGWGKTVMSHRNEAVCL
jgi:hypothetical protein